MIKNQSFVNQVTSLAQTTNGEAVSLAGMNGFACAVHTMTAGQLDLETKFLLKGE